MSYVARPEHIEISVDDFEEKEEAVDEEKVEDSFEETCSICLDGGVDRALSCGHAFHDACLAGLVRSRVDEARVRDIRCPGTADAPACDVALSEEEVSGFLDAEGRDKYARFLRLAEDPAAVECPSCGAAAAGEGIVTCAVCFLDFCKVHGTAHPPDAASCRRFARRPRQPGLTGEPGPQRLARSFVRGSQTSGSRHPPGRPRQAELAVLGRPADFWSPGPRGSRRHNVRVRVGDGGRARRSQVRWRSGSRRSG